MNEFCDARGESIEVGGDASRRLDDDLGDAPAVEEPLPFEEPSAMPTECRLLRAESTPLPPFVVFTIDFSFAEVSFGEG